MWNGCKSKHSCTAPGADPGRCSASPRMHPTTSPSTDTSAMAAYATMLSNAVPARWSCPLGLSSTKPCHLRPSSPPPPHPTMGILPPSGNASGVSQPNDKVPKQNLVNQNSSLGYVHGHFHRCCPIRASLFSQHTQ